MAVVPLTVWLVEKPVRRYSVGSFQDVTVTGDQVRPPANGPTDGAVCTQTAGGTRKISKRQRIWRKESNGAMFEPEYLNLTCPGCRHPEVYFDRDTGFYCMFCSRPFSIEEIQFLIDTETLRASAPCGRSDSRPSAGTRSRHRRTRWTHLGRSLSRFFATGKHLL